MMAAAPLLFLPLLLLLLLIGPVSSAAPPPMTDASALLLLKDSFTNASSLSSWAEGDDGSANPCDPKAPWPGVVCFRGIVTSLRLGGMGLGGTVNVDALAHFKGLRSVSFSRNALSGPIPDLSRLDALKAIFLENNRFSGDVPEDFFVRMDHLKKLWLSGNAFTGPIPSSLSVATGLLELHLENNRFSGNIPALVLPSLASFNVSNNNLNGAIPKSLSMFNASSFAGNSGLCGEQVGKPCGAPQLSEPLPPGGDSGKVAGASVVLILLACVLVVGLAAAKRRREGDFGTLGVDNREVEGGGVAGMDPSSHRKKYAGGSGHNRRHESGYRRTGSSVKAGGGGHRGGGGGGGGAMGNLVMVNETKGTFGMPDLMKAAAEVLGSGGLGSAYKAVMENGVGVAVKRMRDMNKVGKETFDVEMRRLGRLRHPNVLPPLAYHYRKDEKLLVLEYIPKGSLLYILHGDRGPDHEALDWPTRLKIVRGIASGMAYLHAELNSLDIPHGNLKSGNVLLGSDFEPLLVDYGFISLVNPSQASQNMFAYKSPESLELRHVSPKSDVYCLGILILEVLTGKFPSQYLNNTKGGTDVIRWVTSAIVEGREAELLDPAITVAKSSVPDMEGLLRVGAACIEADPDRRPDMKEAAARVEEVAAGGDRAGVGTAPAPTPTPTLKDGCAELSRSRQWRTKSIGELSARRSDDGFAFAIS